MEKNLKIGELLIDSGIIDPFQLNLALAYSRHWGCRLGEALVALGFLTEQNLGTFLVKQFNLPQVNLITSKISKDVLCYIPESKAREYCVIPVDRITKRGVTHLIVAMPDPTNLHVIDRLQFIADCWIVPTMVSADLILHAIDLNYCLKIKSNSRSDLYKESNSLLWSHNQSKFFEIDSINLKYKIEIIEKYFIKLLRILGDEDRASAKQLEDILINFVKEKYS